MKRKTIILITAAASAITLSAAGCGGGSYSAAHPLHLFAGDVKPGETRAVGDAFTANARDRLR